MFKKLILGVFLFGVASTSQAQNNDIKNLQKAADAIFGKYDELLKEL